jgi:hypothetical protein
MDKGKCLVLFCMAAQVYGSFLLIQDNVHAGAAKKITEAKEKEEQAKLPRVHFRPLPSGSGAELYQVDIPKEIAGTTKNLKCLKFFEELSCDWEGAKLRNTQNLVPQ